MPRPEQTEIVEIEGGGDGVGRKRVLSIDRAARKYVDVRDQRMALTEKEVDAKAVLSNAMHEAGLTRYRYDDFEVICEPGKEKIKVKTVDEDGDSESDD